MGNQCCSKDDPTNSGVHDDEPYPKHTKKEMYGGRTSSAHSDDSSEDESFIMMNNNSHMNVMPKRKNGEMKLVLHMCEKEDDEK